MNEQRTAYIEGLRELADALEQRPELLDGLSPVMLYCFTQSRADFVRRADELGGDRSKTFDDWYVNVRRTFGPHAVEVCVNREQVCRKVVTGERLVPAKPAEPEHVEEVVEWVCDDPVIIGREAVRA